jgi:hypothetical protein
VITAVAVTVIVAESLVVTVLVSAVPAVVRTIIIKPVGTATPVIDFAKIPVASVFFVYAMVVVLVMIVATDTWPRRVTRRVIIMLVMNMVAVG